MFLRIENLPEKMLVGKRLSMSLNENKTGELWRSFMPRRKEIQNVLSSNLFSLQIYGLSDFRDFGLNAVFEKWAVMEVGNFDHVPEEMETLILPAGAYAVFLHRGPATVFEPTFDYIFRQWIPASGYEVDNRPHFELLGEKYKNDSPDSEEEIWIPIRGK